MLVQDLPSFCIAKVTRKYSMSFSYKKYQIKPIKMYNQVLVRESHLEPLDALSKECRRGSKSYNTCTKHRSPYMRKKICAST